MKPIKPVTKQQVKKISRKLRESIRTVVKRQLFDMFLILLPIALFLSLLAISYYLFLTRHYISTHKITKLPIKVAPIISYPVVKESSELSPQLSARAALVMDDDTKALLYAKNAHLRFSIASTTKIMTALLALEYFKPNDALTVKDAGTVSGGVGFRSGENVPLIDLLYAMLLPSANDAPLVIAQNYLGGVDAFVAKMNEKAHLLKLYNTHFGDPIGLVDEQNYSTALDLARLASFALKNKTIADVVSTKEKIISTSDGTYHLSNLNRLLGWEGISGVKTGHTREAGEVLITSRVENGRTQIIVVMGSEDRFLDTQRLVSAVSGKVEYVRY